MTVERAKLCDGLINFSAGKTRQKTKIKKEWLPYSDLLTTKGGVIRDSEIIGFQVSRTGQDTISFRYNYRLNGKRKNLTIGQFPAITSTQARRLVQAKALDVVNEIDPLAEKQAKRIDTSNTLRSYLDHDYTLHMQSRAISHRQYLGSIRKSFPELLDKPLPEITKTDLVKWLQEQMKHYQNGERGYASATIRSKYSTLKTLFSHAVRNDVIDVSPFDKMDRLDFNREEDTKAQVNRTYLSIEQQRAFLASVDAYDQELRKRRRNSRNHGKPYLPDLDALPFASHHKPMYLLLYYMGMRQGDVNGLDWAHVTLDDNPFTSANITKVLEKTRRKVKTPFTLPMPDVVCDALKAWRVQNGNPETGLVFPNPETGKRQDKTCLKRSWNWIKDNAGFQPGLHLYSLRHNFASWLVMKGIPLKTVASMLGHKSTDMVERHYSHLIEGATTSASNAFVSVLEDNNNSILKNNHKGT